MRLSQTTTLLGAVGFFLVAGTAAGQDTGTVDNTPDETTADDASASADSSLAEPDDEVVVILGRKRNLQDFSGVAAAFSEKKLQTVGVTKVQDLAQMVPGLQIGVQEGAVEVYIRGVGNDNNSEHGDMGVAMSLDNVYLPRPRGVGAMFYDVKQVEVNSGPQGTLRGRNSQGGSINIVSNKPNFDQYEASGEATFGTFAERRYQGMVNVPVTDSFAIRWAGMSAVHDPHWENIGRKRDLRGAQDENAYSWRLQASWEPTSNLLVTAAYDYTHEGGTGYVGSNFIRALNDGVDAEDIEQPRHIYQLGHQSKVDMTHQGFRLDARWDLDWAIVEALGSYRDLQFTARTGGSVGPIYDGFNWDDRSAPNYDEPIYFGGSYSDFPSQSYVGELRMLSSDDARFKWTVGGFLLDEEQEAYLGQVSDPADFYGGAEFNMPNVHSVSWAGYADFTFDVTEDFRLIAGARLTSEYKDRIDGVAMQLGGLPGNVGRLGSEGFKWAFRDRRLPVPTNEQMEDVEFRVNYYLDGISSFGAQDTMPQVLCADPVAGEPRIEQVDGKLRCSAGVHPDRLLLDDFDISALNQSAKVTARFLDYRAGAEYDVTKNSLAYLMVSSGHKAPGYNDTVDVAGIPPFSPLYGEESVTALELGTKNDLFNRSLRVNASAFAYLYSDQVFQQLVQLAEADASGNAPTTSLRENAASSKILGLDLDLIYRMPYGLEAEVHALFLDARYDDETLVQDGRVDNEPYVVDIGGNILPRSSKYTLNYSLSQMTPTSAGMFDWVVQFQTRGEHFMSVFNGQGNLLPRANGEPLYPTNDDGSPAPGVSPNLIALGDGETARLTDVVPAYTRIDLGGGWAHPDGRISIRGYVNNLFNIAYATSINSTPNSNSRFFNAPRTAGVRVRVDW